MNTKAKERPRQARPRSPKLAQCCPCHKETPAKAWDAHHTSEDIVKSDAPATTKRPCVRFWPPPRWVSTLQKIPRLPRFGNFAFGFDPRNAFGFDPQPIAAGKMFHPQVGSSRCWFYKDITWRMRISAATQAQTMPTWPHPAKYLRSKAPPKVVQQHWGAHPRCSSAVPCGMLQGTLILANHHTESNRTSMRERRRIKWLRHQPRRSRYLLTGLLRCTNINMHYTSTILYITITRPLESGTCPIHLLARAGLNLNLVWEIVKLICSSFKSIRYDLHMKYWLVKQDQGQPGQTKRMTAYTPAYSTCWNQVLMLRQKPYMCLKERPHTGLHSKGWSFVWSILIEKCWNRGRLELRLPDHHALGSSRPQDLIEAISKPSVMWRPFDIKIDFHLFSLHASARVPLSSGRDLKPPTRTTSEMLTQCGNSVWTWLIMANLLNLFSLKQVETAFAAERVERCKIRNCTPSCA